jgi:hypothetical protein
MLHKKYDEATDTRNGLHKDYRKDWRTDEQFANDIAKAHVIEKDIIEAYAEHLRITLNKEVIVEDNGVDNSGKVLDLKSVNSKADYKVNGVLVEVKYNKNMMDDFRFKKDQLDSYLRQGAYVLWVNGWETEEPEFALLSPFKLKEIKKTRRPFPYKYWGYKMCYELRRHSFKWNKFEGLNT